MRRRPINWRAEDEVIADSMAREVESGTLSEDDARQKIERFVNGEQDRFWRAWMRFQEAVFHGRVTTA